MKVHRNYGRHDGAFSLVEVLVASAVLSIVLMILLGVLATSLGLWRGTESKLQVDREGRAAMLLLAEDLAGALLPANSNLWPRVVNERLQFLTVRPTDDQAETDSGDVCFVEYYFDEEEAALMRSFRGSKETYDNIIEKGSFPNPGEVEGLMLAANVLDRTGDAVRGSLLEQWVTTNTFVLLNTNLTVLSGPYSLGNRPAAVEVTVAGADATSMQEENQRIWRNNESLPLRNAGLFSARFYLPSPQTQ